jgi:hypothetical protein
VLAALRAHVGSLQGVTPDTGSLREDVLALLRQAARSFGAAGPVGPDIVRGLTAELQDLERTDAFLVIPRAMRAVLERAAARGEVRLERITARVLALPGDLVRHEILTTQAAPAEAVLESIVDEIFLPLISA